MEWFSGSIPEAITLSKSQNSIFVVFITDGSEASAATEACLGRADTGLKQSSVAIKLASNSEEAQQFNQIYPILVLPSLYFINPSNGVPVEILAGAVTDENLAAKIPTILKDCTSQNSAGVTPEQLEQTSVESPASVAVTEDSSVGTITTPPAPPSSLTADPTPGGAVSNDESTTQIIPESSVSDSACIPADQSLSTSVVTDEINNPINVEPSTSVSSVPAPAYVSSSSSAPASVSSSSSAPASVLSSLAPTSVSSSSSASPSVPSVAADKISEQKDTGLEGEDGEESSVPLEDRVARARKLAELKKQQREQEQFQKDHEEEIRRRQMGKSIHQMKQEQEEKELKDLAAERKKDKEMDRLAREKVKAQIAADRAEREERNALLRGNVPASPAPAAPPSASGSSSSSSATSCRLKLRLPDGSSELARFEPSVMLSEVRQHVQQNIKLPFTRFKLVSSVHQRPFTDQDMNTSLADLGLAPSAIVLVMPSNIGSGKNDGGSGVVSVSTSWLESLMWLIMLPVNAVMSIVSSFFGGATQGTQSQASTSETSGGAAPEPGAGNTRRAAERPKTAYGTRSQARYRQEGNIHRLGNDDDDDDDDENNTWNGNSTQQM